jgi:TRAP-type mannitol/chloroaromatic compound transport system substrate-binding protein
MRSGIIGMIVGVVVGIVIGATVIAPRLHPAPKAANATPPAAPADVARDLPKLLLPRPAVEMKMAGAFDEATPLAGSLGRRFDTRLSETSRGQMEVRFFQPGALVPAADLLDSIAAGAVDAGFVAPGLLAPKTPALQLFGGIPFGPGAEELLAWINFGGGRELLADIAGRQGVHAIVCGLLPAAAAGWFREEIETAADLRGLRMRAVGLGATALARLGVEVKPIDPTQIAAALEDRSIDAAALSAPAIDKSFGLQSRVSNYYFPGWQQSPSALLLVINKQKWDGLKSSQRMLMETVCGDNVSFALAQGEAVQLQAIKDLYAQGVAFQRWPSPLREDLRRAWTQIAEELANRDAEFRRAWTSLAGFRDQYRVWRDLTDR